MIGFINSLIFDLAAWSIIVIWLPQATTNKLNSQVSIERSRKLNLWESQR